MDDIIEILDSEKQTETSSLPLPVNFIAVGDVSRDSIQIYLKQDVYEQIEKHAKDNKHQEVGSILVGDVVVQNEKKYLIVSSRIEAKYADNTVSTLTFTHETWDYVHKQHSEKYSDKKIVGWQHTHPNYDIFLSSYDLFIHENFFNISWQVAYVVDPINDTRGFFEWKGGKVERISGFYVYDDIGKRLKLPSTKVKEAVSTKKYPLMNIILSLALITSLVFLSIVFLENENIKNRLNETMSMLQLQDMVKLPDSSQIDSVVADSANDVIENEVIENEVIETDVAESSEMEKDVVESNNFIKFKIYIIQEGDSLTSICAKNGIGYNENILTIKRINGIVDSNKIYTGQEIYLPVTE